MEDQSAALATTPPSPAVEDLRDEGAELRDLLSRLGDDDFGRPTLFKAWTPDDIVLHLYAGDFAAGHALRGPAEFERYRRGVEAGRSGLSTIEETRRRFPGLGGKTLLDLWWAQLDELCGKLAAADPSAKVPWIGPPMALPTFIAARQMETWAHGQAAYDMMGRGRVASDRIANIAALGVRTYRWSFANRGLEPPTPPPRVVLTAPSGARWTWSGSNEAASVTGDAVEFCQVVTQVRGIADTSLAVAGYVASAWMAVAQCFAGPPSDPPAKGVRHAAV